MFCIHCGARHDAGARFCASCGSPIAAATASRTPYAGVLAARPTAPGAWPALLGTLPTGLAAAAILYGLSALVTLALAGLQLVIAFVGAAGGSTDTAGTLLFGAAWNGALGVFDCVVAQRILARKRFGYDWGLGSGVLNTILVPILFFMNLATGAYLTALFQLLLAPLALATAVLLYANRRHFPPK